MARPYIKATTRLRDEMASPSPLSPIFFSGTSDPNLDGPAMAILRSSHKAGKTTPPQGKSFKELLSRLGQRSQLAAPKYADSTKLMNGFVWGTLDSVRLLSRIHRLLSLFLGSG